MVKRWMSLTLALVCVVLLGVSSVSAQSNNPTIGQIQADKAAYIDRILTLSGTVRAIDDNEWMLSDGTGEIEVDAGPPWYQRITIPSGTQVTITGQIDYADRGSDRIDLDGCRIVTPSQTFEIRDCSFSGPPPWAGGPNRRGR
jgi:uncharacterized protein YdeI (BOF family)